MAFVLMVEAGHRLAVGQPKVALGPLQRLDVRLFIHRQQHRVVGRMQIQPHDVGRLGRELRVGADAPAAPPLQVNALAAQHPPDLMRRDVAQGLSHQRAAPGRVAARRRIVELGQNPPARAFVITPPGARARGVVQTREPAARKTAAPFAHCRRSNALRPGNRPATASSRGSQDNTPSQRQALLGLRAANPAFKHPTILRQHRNRHGFLDHAVSLSCNANLCK